MVRVIEVKTRKQKRQFVNFPSELYKDSPYYVHPLIADEMDMFNPKKNVSYDECEIVYYLAYQGKKVVGRVCAVIQKVYNAKTQSKRVRFGRLDFIDDFEVCKALLDKVEEWAKLMGMDTVHGPLGFNDLEREGLLIEGFDRIATFEENYNYPYYKEYIERCGYEKEIDYLSFRINLPKESNERLVRLKDAVMKRYKLHLATAKTKREYLAKYKDQIFDVLDEAYGDLYGVIPYSEKLRKQIIDQFKLVINKDFIVTILDENDRVVAFGFALPELCYAVKKSKGKLFPFGLFRILHATKHGDTADFGLVGVRKAYQGKGLTAIILDYIINMAKHFGIEHIETNHSLETNAKILQTWKNFDDVTNHKRYRCFIKALGDTTSDVSSQLKPEKEIEKSKKMKVKTTSKKKEKSTKKAHK